VLAAIAGYIVSAVANGTAILHRLVQLGKIRGWLAFASNALYFLTPKSLVSPLVRRSVSSEEFTLHNSVGLGLWAVGSLAAMVALAVWRTQRKEV
jgi:hypothetical protein